MVERFFDRRGPGGTSFACSSGMTGNLICHRDCELPIRLVVILINRVQSISAKETRTPVTKNVHLEPGLMRLFNKSPPVCLAGIKVKLPFAAFTASLTCFDSFRTAHRINLSVAMSFGCS